MTYKSFDSRSDLIDSRDVIAKIADLEGVVADLRKTHGDAYDEAVKAAPDDRTADQQKIVEAYQTDRNGYVTDMLDGDWDAEELKTLQALAEEGERFPNWKTGVTLINEDYFEEYAKFFAEDLGVAVDEWPGCYIDWEQAANSLRNDYSEVQYEDRTFLVRS